MKEPIPTKEEGWSFVKFGWISVDQSLMVGYMCK